MQYNTRDDELLRRPSYPPDVAKEGSLRRSFTRSKTPDAIFYLHLGERLVLERYVDCV